MFVGLVDVYTPGNVKELLEAGLNYCCYFHLALIIVFIFTRPGLLLLFFSCGLNYNFCYFHVAWIMIFVIFTRRELLFFFIFNLHKLFPFWYLCFVILCFMLKIGLVFLLLFLMITMLTLLFSSIAQKMADRTKLSSCNKYFELKGTVIIEENCLAWTFCA